MTDDPGTPTRPLPVRHAPSWDRDLEARVSGQLAETVDPEEAVARLARLLVPALGDWAVITLVEHDEDQHRGGPRLRDAGWWHADPGARALVERYAASRLGALTRESLLAEALQSARPVLVPAGATAAVRAVLAPGRAHDVIGELGPEHAVIQPVRARGRTVGAISLFGGPGRAPVTETELRTLAVVADRAGLALDNALLYRRQRHVAEVFQRSLLTAPVEPDHMQVVVRYQPAAVSAKVGGDWYDAFLQRDGATVVVIGDVVGHDIEAAALMGQIRSMLRGIAVATGHAPAALLRDVDAAVRTLQLPAMASAVVARFEQTPDERERGVTRLRWSNAGHLPPLVIHPDGSVLPLTALGNDVILGVVPDAERREHEVVLDRGSTVLLYTDGLVERRDADLRGRIEQLRAVLAELADLPLDDLCDEVVRRLNPERAEDDVALVAVRLHRQDRPRPAEAGPNHVPPDVAADR